MELYVLEYLDDSGKFFYYSGSAESDDGNSVSLTELDADGLHKLTFFNSYAEAEDSLVIKRSFYSLALSIAQSRLAQYRKTLSRYKKNCLSVTDLNTEIKALEAQILINSDKLNIFDKFLIKKISISISSDLSIS